MSGTHHKEKRWIILGDDGRHVTVGRHSDPTEDELAAAAAGLKAAGRGGWLAVTEGQYYSRSRLTVMMVRELAPAREPWDVAVAAFHAARKHGIAFAG